MLRLRPFRSPDALKNGATLDYGITRAKCFDAMCPDECRVHVHGKTIEEKILIFCD